MGMTTDGGGIFIMGKNTASCSQRMKRSLDAITEMHGRAGSESVEEWTAVALLGISVVLIDDNSDDVDDFFNDADEVAFDDDDS